MATVIIDMMSQPPTASIQADGQGEIKMLAQVRGLLSTDSGSLIIEAINTPGVPQIGDALTGAPGLFLGNLDPYVVDGTPDTVEIELTYVTANSRTAQYLFGIDAGFGSPSAQGRDFQLEFNGSLQQNVTSYDLFGNQFRVDHTWPLDDKVEERQGQDEPQSRAQDVDDADLTVSTSGPIRVAYPHILAISWLNHVNLNTWLGFPPNTWKCTQFDLVLQDLNPFPAIWNLSASFQATRNGWFLPVNFLDDTINQPAVNLVPGVGSKLYQVYPARDFGRLFPW